VAALVGLSNLRRSDPSDAAYGAALEDLELHFGLPQPLRAEARWYFGQATPASTPLRRSGDFLRQALTDRSESYWEWLRRTESSPRDGSEHNYQHFSGNPMEARTKPRGGSST
jgi:hypothetical protein